MPPVRTPCNRERLPTRLADSHPPFPLMPFPPDLLKLALEQVVDLRVRQATLSPAFPDRSQDLLERLHPLRPRSVQVCGHHIVDVDRGILATLTGKLLELLFLVWCKADGYRHHVCLLGRRSDGRSLRTNELGPGFGFGTFVLDRSYHSLGRLRIHPRTALTFATSMLHGSAVVAAAD